MASDIPNSLKTPALKFLMALHLVLSRSPPFKKASSPVDFSRISFYSESEEWSTINLHPQFPNKFDDDKYGHSVECSGDGLLCFRFGPCGSDDDYAIWNPSTDKFQLIPPTDSRNLPCSCSSRGCIGYVLTLALGLGFVAKSHHYKLVRFMSNYNVRDNDGRDHDLSDHAAVYSSETNSWKEVLFPFEIDIDVLSPDSTCVNGFIYWMHQTGFVISFDLSSDTFSTLLYPDHIPLYDRVYLLELDGSLCLVFQFETEPNAKLFGFWVYEPSPSPSPWIRKIHLDVRLDADIPLWLGNKNNGGEFLILVGFDGALLEYDYTTRELKKCDQLQRHHYQHNRHRVTITPCVEIKNKVNSDVVDRNRISQLPDEMILCILSFLSLKEAASTSALSTRWSDLWRHTPNLNFHDIHLKRYKHKYIKWVNSVVESHKALSLKEFSISFPINYLTRNKVIKWLKFAFSRRVEVLELNLLGRRFDFLENFLRKRTVLKSTNLTSVCLKCLKVSGSAIGLFLRNCPLLERLIIKSALLTSDLEVCGNALKHLDIEYCKGGILIKGYAPNLTSLKIDSSPFDFSLDDYDHDNDNDNHIDLAWAAQHSADEPPLFPFISSQLTTLEFTLHFPPEGFFGNRFPQVPTLRELFVTYLFEHGIRPITCLICAFPYLEEFEIKGCRHIEIDESRTVVRQGMEAVERFCHRYLRVFKFTWFDGSDSDHMELMSYILDNCIALQKIILESPSTAEYANQLQSKLPAHIQLIINFNNCHLV